MKMNALLRSLLPLAFVAALAMPSTYGATIQITGVLTPNGSIVAEGNPAMVADYSHEFLLSWEGVGFEVINGPSQSVLSMFGTVYCPNEVGCTGSFAVDFFVFGRDPGLSASLGLTGTYNSGFFSFAGASVTAFVDPLVFPATNGTIGPVSLNGTAEGVHSFDFLTPAVGLEIAGNFSGRLMVDFFMNGGANVTLPRGSTADLFLTPTATGVPEPTTLGILAGAGALLAYLKRMKRA